MFRSLEVFQLANQMAVHAGKRQALIAENVANADTPDFRARDILSFQELVQPKTSSVMRATRAEHLNGAFSNTPDMQPFQTREAAELNGNSVSIETEMLKAVETKRQHDRALMIYKSGLTVLHATLA